MTVQKTGAQNIMQDYLEGVQSEALRIRLTAFMTPMATAAIPYMMDYGGYDQPTMFKMSWRPAILFTVVAVAWTMTIFPIL